MKDHRKMHMPSGSTISHHILAKHGAASTAFLSHLEQTWSLHQQTAAQLEGFRLEQERLEQAKKDAQKRQAECEDRAKQFLDRATKAEAQVAALKQSLERYFAATTCIELTDCTDL